MAKMVKYSEDMATKFKGKTAPDRIGARYDALKTLAIKRYAAKGLAARSLIEAARKILSEKGIPAGVWGVYIGFVLKLFKISDTYAGAIPAGVLEGFKKEYTHKGADPAVLDTLSGLLVGR